MCLQVDLGDLLRLLLPEALPTPVVWHLSLLPESSSGCYVTFSSLPALPCLPGAPGAHLLCLWTVLWFLTPGCPALLSL